MIIVINENKSGIRIISISARTAIRVFTIFLMFASTYYSKAFAESTKHQFVIAKKNKMVCILALSKEGERRIVGDLKSGYHVMPSLFENYLDGIKNNISQLPKNTRWIWLGPVHQQTESVNYYLENGKLNSTSNDVFYWPSNHDSVDASLGGKKKFSELIHKAANLGIEVFVDAVIGHWGYIPEGGTVQFNGSLLSANEISDYVRADESVSQEDWDRLEMARSPEDVLAVQEVMSKKRLFGLPGFNHTHPEVEKYLINAYKKFIDLGVTGFRVDAVMYVQRGFTAKFINELNSYALNKGKRLTFVLEILARNNNSINPIIEDLLSKIEMKDRIFFLDFPLMYELRRIHFQADYDLRWLVGFMKYRSEIKMQTERMVPTIINHDFGTVMNDANDEKAIYALAEVFSFQPSVMFHGSEQTGRIKNNREQIHDIQEQGDIAILENIFYETLKPYRADRYVFTNTIIHEESRDCLLLEKKLDKRSIFLFVSKGDVGSSHFAKFLTQQKQSKILIRYINGEPILHRDEGSEVVTLTSKGKSILLFEVISK